MRNNVFHNGTLTFVDTKHFPRLVLKSFALYEIGLSNTDLFMMTLDKSLIN